MCSCASANGVSVLEMVYWYVVATLSQWYICFLSSTIDYRVSNMYRIKIEWVLSMQTLILLWIWTFHWITGIGNKIECGTVMVRVNSSAATVYIVLLMGHWHMTISESFKLYWYLGEFAYQAMLEKNLGSHEYSFVRCCAICVGLSSN